MMRRAGLIALLMGMAAGIYAQTESAPASKPAEPVIAAMIEGGKLTVSYKGRTISSGEARMVSAVKQVSPTRIDLTFTAGGTLPRFVLPVEPYGIGGAPITVNTNEGPAVATYEGKDFKFTAASADEDVNVYQAHDAPGAEHPEYRAVGIKSLRDGKRELTLSLCVDGEDLTPFSAAYAAAHPMKLKWTDRRPIAHLANDDRQAMQFTMRNWALMGINLCKSIDGQIALYQGLEGMDDKSGFKYMGCPELIDEIRNESPGNKLADLAELFKKAGIGFGFCIRPWAFVKENGKWVVDKTVSPEEALDRKLAFLTKLGATAVYIDSCDTRTAKWLADLQAKYPHILMIPEQPNAGIRNSAQLAYGAPLRECADGQFSPLPQLYPDAFQVLLHAEGLTDKQWEFVINSNGKFVPFVQPHETVTLQRLRKLMQAKKAATAPAAP